MSHTLYIPQVNHNARIGQPPSIPAKVSGLTPAQRIVQLMCEHPGQLRPSITVDPRLQAVAQARAADMHTRNYFSHTDPEGYGPNYHVTQAGYKLPGWYNHDKDGNNIESIAAGYKTAEAAFAGWLASPGHRAHLLGEHVFYAEQIFIGVGVSGLYWVVLTAHPSGTA